MKLPGGQEVADADRKSKGLMTFADIVAWSRNVGVSQVAFRLGKTTTAASAALYKTWQAYGIGQKTGIDLAGEVAGIVHDPAASPWSQIDLANASFGQGVAVPPIQMVTRLLGDGKRRPRSHAPRRRARVAEGARHQGAGSATPGHHLRVCPTRSWA